MDNGNRTWNFIPETNWNGSNTFSYIITDGANTINASANLAVDAVNDAPAVSGEVDLGMINDGTQAVFSDQQLLAKATDVDGDSLAVESLTASHGSFVNSGDGTWTYISESDYTGSIEISYSVVDSQGGNTPGYAAMEVYPPHVNLIPGTENDEILYGTSGDDALAGKGGNDTLDAGDGNDTLIGGTGNDYLLGGAGDDLLVAGQGNDLVDGGVGHDVYVYQRGDGTLWIRDEGINTLRFDPGISSSDLSLGLGSLLIHTGVAGDEIHIENFNPDDVYEQIAINRFEFADGTVLSYEELLARGFDLEGTNGVNTIDGTSLNDRIQSLAGDDTIIAKTGDDTLDGGSGDDTLWGWEGDDYLYGGDDGPEGESDDYGGYDYGSYNYGGYDYGSYNYGGYDYGGVDSNNDYLDGGSGNDTLDGGSGNDTLFGGEGDDYLYGGDESQASGYDYGGYDYGGYDYGGTTPNDDYLDGGSGSDTLDGGSGDDTLLGGEGDGIDTIYGGSGNDLLDGGSGIDLMEGGRGDDIYYVDGYAEVTVIPGDGNDGAGDAHDCGSHHKPHHQHNRLNRHKRKWNETHGNGRGPSNSWHDHGWDDGQSCSSSHSGQKDGGHDLFCKAHDDGSNHPGHDKHGDSDTFFGRKILNYFYGSDKCSSQNDSGYTIACNNQDNHSDHGSSHNDYNSHFGGCNDHGHCDDHDSCHGGSNGHDHGDGCHDHGDGCHDPGNGQGEDQVITTYVTDTVTEEADSGYDVVYSSITYSLTDHVEELHLTGTDNFDGTGNDLDNRIVGNSGDNTLDGGLGNDLLEGGAGNDTYLFGSGNGQDTILDYDTAAGQNDTVEFSEGLGASDIGLCQSGNDLLLGIAGSDDTLRIENWFQSTENQVENVQLADGNHLTNADINQLIQQMSAYAVDQGIAFNNINDVYNNQDMMTLVANSWQSS